MARKIKKIPLDKIKKHYNDVQDSEINIFLDIENAKEAKEIINLIKQYEKKFRVIFARILKGEYNDFQYKIEAKGVTAIKLKMKNANYRIYCKEEYIDGKKVVLIAAYHKKVQKNKSDPKINEIIKNIQSYNYDY